MTSAMPKSDIGKALQTASELELTVKGRISGKKISFPVWFTYDAGTLLLLPLKGTETNWYKNVVRTPTVSIGLKTASLSLKAETSTDIDELKKTVQSFREKYGEGDVKKYYSKFDACVTVRVL